MHRDLWLLTVTSEVQEMRKPAPNNTEMASSHVTDMHDLNTVHVHAAILTETSSSVQQWANE